MNKRDWKYARVLGGGIKHAIREMAHAGFRVDRIIVNKQDRKILRNANPTRSYMIAGVPLEADEQGEMEPYSKSFRTITNAPEGGNEMLRGMSGFEIAEDVDIEPRDSNE